MKLSSRIVEPTEERPLELLYACHEKVRHFTDLALRLADHIEKTGADEAARDAATAILRYFDKALPLHHADEEEDVFPALLSLSEADLVQSIQKILNEHSVLDAQWQRIAPWLRRIAEGKNAGERPAILEDFVQAYARHAASEEADIFSHITHLPTATVDAIGQRMRARRGA